VLVDSFRESVSLQDLSRSAGVHPARIARQFRRVYGMTTGACVRKLRIDFVAEQLSAQGTNAEDLAKWDTNFYQPRVGGEQAIQLLLSQAILNNGLKISYALGLFVEKYRGFTMVWP
jgi:AraC-like DNA-binding protein